MLNDDTQVVDDTLTQESSEEPEDTESSDTQEESVDWKAEAKKWEAIAKRNKEKQEKATAAPKVANTANLNQLDLIYLAKADIHEEDISEVLTYAEKVGVSVKEAHDYLRPRLDFLSEQRKTANATEVKSGRGKKPRTGEDYLEQARKTGEVPDSDDAMRDLILARQKKRN